MPGQEGKQDSHLRYAGSCVSVREQLSLRPRGGGRTKDVTPLLILPPSPFLRAFPFLIFLQKVCVSGHYPCPSNSQDGIPNHRDAKSSKDKPGVILPPSRPPTGWMSDPWCLESGPSSTALFKNSPSFTHAQGILVKSRDVSQWPKAEGSLSYKTVDLRREHEQ